jgi:hypothetical protein
VDFEQLPHLFVSYNDEAQIQNFFNSLIYKLSSGVSFSLASSKGYSFESPERKTYPFFKYYFNAGDESGCKEKFILSLSREMRLRSWMLKGKAKEHNKAEKQMPDMVIILHDVFDIILSRKKSIGMIFLKLLLMGKELKMHVVAASGSTYRNLLKQLAQMNPLVMEKFKTKLGLTGFQMSTSLGAELVMTAEDFVFFKAANQTDYHRLYPASDKQPKLKSAETVSAEGAITNSSGIGL